MDSRRAVLWVVAAGAACLGVFLVARAVCRPDRHPQSSALSLTAGPATSLPAVSPTPSWPEGAPVSPPSPPKLALAPTSAPDQRKSTLVAPPVPDQAAVELRRKMMADVQARLRADTNRLYAEAFRQLHLSADLQDKVIDILTEPQRQLEQQASEAAQSGTFPMPPSAEAIRAQQAQQEQQLRSVLGEAGFAAFNQYRATLPDRLIVDAMNQRGANLSETQSGQLLQVLSEARQQVIGNAGATQNLSSMPPAQAVASLQQQQTLLQQTVSNQSQSILTPGQMTTLKATMASFSPPP